MMEPLTNASPNQGPLAVLPLQDGSYGVIWTCTPARAAEILAFDDATYLRELQERLVGG